ncbi:MAG: BatD family protein, partial [Pseudomonadales bacterium]
MIKFDKTLYKLLTIVVSVLFALDVAHAAIVAKIDRPNVEQNESFDLELIVDSDTDSTPDFSVLEADFDIGQTSQLTNTSIINGQISHSRTWKVTLMAKRSGNITIPPIAIGGERSNAVSINVSAPSDEPPGEADVFVTAEVDFAETFVQAQVLYTIKIYRAVAWRQPALREPTFDGAEVLIELVGDESDYQAVLNGRAYDVIQRTYAIYPQESGDVTISPTRFEARVLRDGRITGRKVFESEAQRITVKPIPPPPSDHPNAAWLPAIDVTLDDNWSREPDDLSAGEPISRNVTVSALGQLETQLPVIDPPAADGVSIYPDKPALGRRIEAGGIRGIRTDQYAMIANTSGVISLPSLELPWWDIAAGEWRIARLPERSVNILPSDDVAVVQPAPEVPLVSETNVAPPPTMMHSTFWRRIAELLAFVWLLTIVAWWWSTRPRREMRGPE